mgnify:CR=1 FL=1
MRTAVYESHSRSADSLTGDRLGFHYEMVSTLLIPIAMLIFTMLETVSYTHLTLPTILLV